MTKPCKNNGTCFDNPAQDDFTCECTEAWKGSFESPKKALKHLVLQENSAKSQSQSASTIILVKMAVYAQEAMATTSAGAF